MRLAPPLQGGFREAINDFIFNGFFIPKGWKVCIYEQLAYWFNYQNSTTLNTIISSLVFRTLNWIYICVQLYWSANSTHKSGQYFSEPEKFDPSRFEGGGPAPYTFVPFGGGPRMCPGKEYARLEILVFMHHLVKRFRFEKLIPDEKIVVDPMPIPAKGLPVRLFPHKG
ncbi:unnamed protein product [Linum tenue]|uniref:Cytochrome P450 n=1 Tax=Linum tenue TaxID=586396 RepID=A0AAV0K186_9ROSI|nr:unnamed protein product [Linum tenue]